MVVFLRYFCVLSAFVTALPTEDEAISFEDVQDPRKEIIKGFEEEK